MNCYRTLCPEKKAHAKFIFKKPTKRPVTWLTVYMVGFLVSLWLWQWPVAQLVKAYAFWPSRRLTSVGGLGLDPHKEQSVFTHNTQDWVSGWQLVPFSPGAPVFFPFVRLRSIHLHFQKIEKFCCYDSRRIKYFCQLMLVVGSSCTWISAPWQLAPASFLPCDSQGPSQGEELKLSWLFIMLR